MSHVRASARPRARRGVLTGFPSAVSGRGGLRREAGAAPACTVMSHVRASARRRARRVVLTVYPSAFSGRTGSPADFASWVERGMGRQESLVPDSWKTRSDLPIDTKSRVGVVLHVYFPELLDEILRQLTAIPVTFDLIVTNATAPPRT